MQVIRDGRRQETGAAPGHERGSRPAPAAQDNRGSGGAAHPHGDGGAGPSRDRVRRTPADPFLPLELKQVASANDCTGLTPATVNPEEIPGADD